MRGKSLFHWAIADFFHLSAPLQHQAQANLDLLEALKRHHSGEDGSAALGQLDKRNVDIFFRNFYVKNKIRNFLKIFSLKESSLDQVPLEGEEEVWKKIFKKIINFQEVGSIFTKKV